MNSPFTHNRLTQALALTFSLLLLVMKVSAMDPFFGGGPDEVIRTHSDEELRQSSDRRDSAESGRAETITPFEGDNSLTTSSQQNVSRRPTRGRFPPIVLAESPSEADSTKLEDTEGKTISIAVEEHNITSFQNPKPSRTSIDEARRRSGRVNLNDLASLVNINSCVANAASKWKSYKRKSGYTYPKVLCAEDGNTRHQRYKISDSNAALKQNIEEQILAQQQESIKKKSAITNNTARSLARGIPIASYASPFSVFELEAKASHQQVVAQLKEPLSLYALEQDFLNSFFNKRDALLSEKKNADLIKYNTTAKEALSSTQQAGAELIQVVLPAFSLKENGEIALNPEELKTLSYEKINYLYQTISLIREIQLFTLRCHTSLYIAESKEKLDGIETFLKQTLDDANETFTDLVRENYKKSQELFKTSYTTFLLQETISSTEANNAARENAAIMQDQFEVINNLTSSLKFEQMNADGNKINSLKNETRLMEQLQACLQDAALAYREIEDETWIDQKRSDLYKLENRIKDLHASLFSKARALGIEKTVDPLLEKLLLPLNDEAFKLDDRHRLPQDPSEFLNHLKTLSADLNKQAIIGTSGEVALAEVPPKDKDENHQEEDRREWDAGRNLIRLALCRGFGSHVMEYFDQKFEIKKNERNPLQLFELKKFLFDNNGSLRFVRSFFIPPEMTPESFLTHFKKLPNKIEYLSQVIKKDDHTLLFNPFNNEQSLPAAGENFHNIELQQRQKGYEVVKKFLKRAFQDYALPEEHSHEIDQRFENQFMLAHDINERQPLTFTALGDFIRKEKEILNNRSCWERNITPYLSHKDLIKNVLSGLSYAIGNHFGTIIIVPLLYFYMVWFTHTHPSST